MTRPVVIGTYRLAFAALALVAVSAQFTVTLTNNFSIANFFSYFTNLGNIVALVVFAIGGIRIFRGVPDTRAWIVLRLVSVVNMVFVGLVFNILLAGLDVGAVVPWVNVIVHMVMPLAVLADWIIDPPARRMPWSAVPIGLAFPVLYSIYSLVRGAIIGFYPYPFYNPAVQGGYGGVAIYMVVLVVGLAVVSLGAVALARTRRRSTGITA